MLTTLTNNLIDYAGLFPPAALPMPEAVARYARARQGQHAAMLGRFVVPAPRLQEFAQALQQLPNPGPLPWQLSALVGTDPEQELSLIQNFNQLQGKQACVDSLELKASSPAEILLLPKLLKKLASPVSVFVELEPQADLQAALDAIQSVGLYAKIRMGGVTAGAFPAAEQVLGFISACVERQLPFKATAGLHHLLYGSYPLTYAPDSLHGQMYGFLNILLATALLQRNPGHNQQALELLQSHNHQDLYINTATLCWKQECFTATDLHNLRATGMLSFGSCSFDEPCHELQTQWTI